MQLLWILQEFWTSGQDEEINGRNPWTGDSDKVDRYNNVYLMNIGRGEKPISFNDQSQATITVAFAS